MYFGDFEGLKEAFRTIPNDNTVLLVNVQPFVEFNTQPGGYLCENDAEYLDAFAVYADCNYIEVWNVYDVPHMGWGVVEGEPYPFAIPLDAQIEYGYSPL